MFLLGDPRALLLHHYLFCVSLPYGIYILALFKSRVVFARRKN